MQQLASRPSQLECKPIPYGLVSLWDMINYSVKDAHFVLLILLDMESTARNKARQLEHEGGLAPIIHEVDDDTKKSFNLIVAACEKHFSCFEADAIKDQFDHIKTPWRATIRLSWSDHLSDITNLKDAIQRELARQYFFHYPREKGRLLNQVSRDWAATLRAFPSAAKDVNSVVDCYALGHDHASIFHSMMVLERGLPALARRLKVRFNPNKATWADLTSDIVKQIGIERAATSRTPPGGKSLSRSAAKRRGKFLDACEEAAQEFRWFTTVWRNHVAHGRADYDENDAKKVMEHVRSFMEVIAIKLKLKERKAT